MFNKDYIKNIITLYNERICFLLKLNEEMVSPTTVAISTGKRESWDWIFQRSTSGAKGQYLRIT